MLGVNDFVRQTRSPNKIAIQGVATQNEYGWFASNKLRCAIQKRNACTKKAAWSFNLRLRKYAQRAPLNITSSKTLSAKYACKLPMKVTENIWKLSGVFNVDGKSKTGANANSIESSMRSPVPFE